MDLCDDFYNERIICNGLIDNGMIVRYMISILVFYILIICCKNKYIKNYIYLILPIILTLLDKIDNKFILSFINNGNNTTHLSCAGLFNYQKSDKICDSFSYLLAYIFLAICFKVDNILLFLIIYRIIGVILFTVTKNSRWLILFFDFIKEYFIYLFIFHNNYMYIPLFILCKIIFEYYWHTTKNSNKYVSEPNNNIESNSDGYCNVIN
jgi:hypothetical protein